MSVRPCRVPRLLAATMCCTGFHRHRAMAVPSFSWRETGNSSERWRRFSDVPKHPSVQKIPQDPWTTIPRLTLSQHASITDAVLSDPGRRTAVRASRQHQQMFSVHQGLRGRQAYPPGASPVPDRCLTILGLGTGPAGLSAESNWDGPCRPVPYPLKSGNSPLLLALFFGEC